MTNLALLNALAHDAKLVPSFTTPTKYRDLIKRSIKITDHFTCTSTNVIYCITCTYCKKIYRYIGETGRRLGEVSSTFQYFNFQFSEGHSLFVGCKSLYKATNCTSATSSFLCQTLLCFLSQILKLLAKY